MWPATLGLLLASGSPASAMDAELSGYVAVEGTGFASDPLDPAQPEHTNLSLAFAPKWLGDWSDGEQIVRLSPMLRVDQHDRERTHFDVREALWERVAGRWEIRVGVGRVFWGVTESRHLVDVVNQSDAVEDIEGNARLGQPMARLTYAGGAYGSLDLFVLPGFRERTSAGARGRPRGGLIVDPKLSTIESSWGHGSTAVAARWSNAAGPADWGLGYFYGTSREPQLRPVFADSGHMVLAAHYDQIHQVGADVQLLTGGLAWKGESIVRAGQGRTFAAAVGGVEYTIGSLLGTSADAGLYVEYLYDGRTNSAVTPYEHDVFGGLRLMANDTQATTLMGGAMVDTKTGAVAGELEASRRLANDWTLTVEGRLFVVEDEADPLYGLRREDHLRMELKRWF